MADDPFPVPTEPTKESIQDIGVGLFDPGSDAQANGETQGARVDIQVKYSDGTIEVLPFNLVPHLTAAEINGIQNLLTRIRTKSQVLL